MVLFVKLRYIGWVVFGSFGRGEGGGGTGRGEGDSKSAGLRASADFVYDYNPP